MNPSKSLQKLKLQRRRANQCNYLEHELLAAIEHVKSYGDLLDIVKDHASQCPDLTPADFRRIFAAAQKTFTSMQVAKAMSEGVKSENCERDTLSVSLQKNIQTVSARSVRILRPPGVLINAVLELLIPRQPFSTYVQPAIAEWQYEYIDAIAARKETLARIIRIRGLIWLLLPVVRCLWMLLLGIFIRILTPTSR